MWIIRKSDLSCYARGLCAAAMLAGCGGSQSPIGAPGASAQTFAPARANAPKITPLLQWYEFSFENPPPYPVRTKVKYFSGTVPVALAALASPGSSGLYEAWYALLNHTDASGDYAVYLWDADELQWFFTNGYMSGLALDGSNASIAYGVTKKEWIWSSTGDLSKPWTRLFDGFTSLAVRNPTQPNPTGFLFATSNKAPIKGSYGPSGPPILLYDPTGKWPKGSWKSTGWGAYQVSADPLGTDIAALDKNAVVWDINANYTKSGHRFIGYLASQLSATECANQSPFMTFEAVAAKDGAFYALDQQLGHAVWNYSWKNKCWNEVGSKTGFVSISTNADANYNVYATDTKGHIWGAF